MGSIQTHTQTCTQNFKDFYYSTLDFHLYIYSIYITFTPVLSVLKHWKIVEKS